MGRETSWSASERGAEGAAKPREWVKPSLDQPVPIRRAARIDKAPIQNRLWGVTEYSSSATASHVEKRPVLEKPSEAAADYTAGRLVDPFFADLVSSWEAAADPITEAVVNFDSTSELLKECVEKRLQSAGTELRIGSFEKIVGAGICTEYLLAPITKPIEKAATIFEAIGVAVGVLFVPHGLAVVCAKLLLHKEVEHVVSQGLLSLVRSDAADRFGTQPSAFSLSSPDTIIHYRPATPAASHRACRPEAGPRPADADPPTASEQFWLCIGLAPKKRAGRYHCSCPACRA